MKSITSYLLIYLLTFHKKSLNLTCIWSKLLLSNSETKAAQKLLFLIKTKCFSSLIYTQPIYLAGALHFSPHFQFFRCRTLFLFLLQLLFPAGLLIFCTAVEWKMLYAAQMRWKQPYGSPLLFPGKIHFIAFTRAWYTSSTLTSQISQVNSQNQFIDSIRKNTPDFTHFQMMNWK